MIRVLLVVAWISIGAAVGYYEARRGHWRWLWLLGALVGPFALLLAREANDHEPRKTAPAAGAVRTTSHDGLRVLAGLDGSADADSAVREAARLLGLRAAEVTLATVVDFEAAAFPDRSEDTGSIRDDHTAAERFVHETASEMADLLGDAPSTVVLAGKPATALREHALEGGFDLVVVAGRGRGLTKRLLGSCAAGLASDSSVPVIIMPSASKHNGSRALRSSARLD